jgi:pSer/pThr/pTyr-binding forkhead associated (FHA) protein
MAVTVIVRSAASEVARFTFDGTQRVVIGRGAGSDVRLPDASVSHRHASLRAQGADFVLVDEGSTNGTFVGAVRIEAHTSRIIRSGDLVRVGRLWLSLRIEQGALATRDLAVQTRDLALALVSQAMAAVGEDLTPKIRVVEGRDQGRVLALEEAGREYLIGRMPHCELALADEDASREHLIVVSRSGAVFVRDLGAKNGTWLGEARAPEGREVPWRPALMIKLGRTVLALQEPIADALAEIEGAADEVLAPEEDPSPPAPLSDDVEGQSPATPDADPLHTRLPPPAGPAALAAGVRAPSVRPAAAPRWSGADRLVMAAAVSLLALSLAGLVWLLRG